MIRPECRVMFKPTFDFGIAYTRREITFHLGIVHFEFTLTVRCFLLSSYLIANPIRLRILCLFDGSILYRVDLLTQSFWKKSICVYPTTKWSEFIDFSQGRYRFRYAKFAYSYPVLFKHTKKIPGTTTKIMMVEIISPKLPKKKMFTTEKLYDIEYQVQTKFKQYGRPKKQRTLTL